MVDQVGAGFRLAVGKRIDCFECLFRLESRFECGPTLLGGGNGLLCLRAFLFQVGEEFLHLGFLCRDALEDGPLLSPLLDSFNATLGRLRVFRAIGDVALGVSDVQPSADVVCFAGQPKCDGYVALVAMDRLVAFLA